MKAKEKSSEIKESGIEEDFEYEVDEEFDDDDGFGSDPESEKDLEDDLGPEDEDEDKDLFEADDNDELEVDDEDNDSDDSFFEDETDNSDTKEEDDDDLKPDNFEDDIFENDSDKKDEQELELEVDNFEIEDSSESDEQELEVEQEDEISESEEIEDDEEARDLEDNKKEGKEQMKGKKSVVKIIIYSLVFVLSVAMGGVVYILLQTPQSDINILEQKKSAPVVKQNNSDFSLEGDSGIDPMDLKPANSDMENLDFANNGSVDSVASREKTFNSDQSFEEIEKINSNVDDIKREITEMKNLVSFVMKQNNKVVEKSNSQYNDELISLLQEKNSKLNLDIDKQKKDYESKINQEREKIKKLYAELNSLKKYKNSFYAQKKEIGKLKDKIAILEKRPILPGWNIIALSDDNLVLKNASSGVVKIFRENDKFSDVVFEKIDTDNSRVITNKGELYFK
jgi:hypothetical protein